MANKLSFRYNTFVNFIEKTMSSILLSLVVSKTVSVMSKRPLPFPTIARSYYAL